MLHIAKFWFIYGIVRYDICIELLLKENNIASGLNNKQMFERLSITLKE